MGKGSRRRRCTITRLEESLRWAIFLEKDKAKKKALLKELEHMLNVKNEWAQLEKQRPELFGSKEAQDEDATNRHRDGPA